jgi:hypothetical protein
MIVTSELGTAQKEVIVAKHEDLDKQFLTYNKNNNRRPNP